ncbi:MAG: MFS transporter, partial [bacterium]|nr:MFS transporter [bacterium]
MNDTRQSRKILHAIGLGTAFSLMGDATLYAVLPTHTEEAGITLAAVGILLGVNRAIRLLSNSVAGWLYDRVSQRKLFVLGLGVGAFSTACYAMSKGLWLLFFGRIAWGIAWSLIWVGGGTISLNISRESDRGRLTGFYQAWFFLGAGTGAFLGGILTDLVGYYSTLRILSCMQAVSVVLVWFLLPPIPKDVPGSAIRDHNSRSVRS